MSVSPPRLGKTGAGQAVRRGFHVAVAVMLTVLVSAGAARASDPVKGDIKILTQDGYTRLVLKLAEPVTAKIQLNWPIMVIAFKKPVSIPVDRLDLKAPKMISAARLDPDGSAIRIALKQKVKINKIPVAERLYVDLLPENWSGLPPGLPQEVVEELAKRAQQAERLMRRAHPNKKPQTPPTIRVRVANQPTFTRYVFRVPEGANVVPEHGKGELTLNFDRIVKWDLADALANLPQSLKSIDAKADADSQSVAVRFLLNGSPKVRTFREDNGIVVDIGHDGAKSKAKPKNAANLSPAKQGAAVLAPPAVANAAPSIAKPETVPAEGKPAANASAKDDGLPPIIDVPAPHRASPAKPKVVEKKAEPAPAAEPKPPVEARATPPASLVPPLDAKPNEHKPPVAPAEQPAKKIVHAGPPPDPKAPVVALLHRDSESFRLEFPFVVPTPAAVFARADMLWMVFDTAARIDVASLASHNGGVIRAAQSVRGADGEAIVRIRLMRPQLLSLDSEGPAWTVTVGDRVTVPSHALAMSRGMGAHNRATIVIRFDHPAKLHRITDPEIGDHLLVVTALGPVRGFLRPQNFVELRTLSSTQGVVVLPVADDIKATLSAKEITLSRPAGLTLSTTVAGEPDATFGLGTAAFDPQVWGFNRKAKYRARQSDLIRMAAAAPPAKRRSARFNLARFYLARGMSAEALGVLEVALSDNKGPEDVTGDVLKAIAEVMLGRPEDALKDLAKPQIGNQLDARIWRGVAYARQAKWAEARQDFKNLDENIGGLPIELQRMVMMAALRTDLWVRDFEGASRLADEFDTVGVPRALEPAYAVLQGRLEQGLGQNDAALANYRKAAGSADRRAAAEGRLREIELRYATKDMPRKDAIAALETLTTVWRGDETETEGLKLLAHLYTEDGRYRDAFHVMRTALLAHPNSELTRQIQDEAATTFDSLFLSHKGDSLPPIKALGLFYDYRELTPIGRRGDEMIRRLADRLVAVDLLQQAEELLQHQVDHRLQGAARAQVATRLAVVYLMDHKPDKALATLRATHMADLADELRDQRLLLEARSLSDIGRHELALEVIADLKSKQAMRLRVDIPWAAKRWREAAEQIELLYGDRWKKFKPLSESERFDILRAAIGYSLANEGIGLARFREKYGPKMAKGPDAHAFAVVTAPIGPASDEFQSVAKRVATINRFDAFLADMRAHLSDGSDKVLAKSDTPAPGAAVDKPAAPKGPAKTDATPTGSIAR
jgi:tetratricopeptide (TPR) repeat protein